MASIKTDFFAAQDTARRKSFGLFILFFSLTIVLSFATALAVRFALGLALPTSAGSLSVSLTEENNLKFALIVFSLLTAAALWMSSTLRGGGLERFLLLRGAMCVPANTTDPFERRFRNVAQEMSIACGMPVPDLFFIPHELSINAFAAGYSPHTYCIVVTEGTLKYLTRAELQAVVAHEFSHLLNDDVRTNMDLLSVLHGYTFISSLGRELMSSRRGGLLGLIIYICGFFGLLLSRLVKAFYSRQREWLADASAVQFTRNADALRSALIKIDLNTYRTVKTMKNAEDFSHMFFVQGISGLFTNLFASHPPLDERIRALGDTNYRSPYETKELSPAALSDEEKIVQSAVSGLQGGADKDTGATAGMQEGQAKLRAHPQRLVAERRVRMNPESLNSAAELISKIPKSLRIACEVPLNAQAVALAVVIFQSSNRVDEVIGRLRDNKSLPHAYLDFIRDEVFPSLKKVDFKTSLTLLEMACDTVRSSPEKERIELVRLAWSVVKIDSHISLTEICLLMLLGSRVLESDDLRSFASAGDVDSMKDILYLIAYVAHIGSLDNLDAAQRAYSGALQVLRLPEQKIPASHEITAGVLLRAIGHVRAGGEKSRRLCVAACQQCVSFDGALYERELLIFRSICSALECPMPELKL
jgi:Zn-dependent protease with chaperone function